MNYSRHPQGRRPSKLTPEQALEIFAKLEAGAKIIDLAKEYGISDGHVCGIRKGDSWGWLTGKRSARRQMQRPKGEHDHWFK